MLLLQNIEQIFEDLMIDTIPVSASIGDNNDNIARRIYIIRNPLIIPQIIPPDLSNVLIIGKLAIAVKKYFNCRYNNIRYFI